jgi:predicted RNA methylase
MQISNGEKRNLKKEYQFFETPDSIADRLIELAEIDSDMTGSNILEPSAGQGAIIKAINRLYPNKVVDCYELMDINRTILSKIKTANLIGNNFLTECNNKYFRIIANPPFSKNQDIDHFYKMYDCLNVGGVLVSIVSRHWQLSQNKKETKFREWIERRTDIIELKGGEFKESGTMIPTYIIKIRK